MNLQGRIFRVQRKIQGQTGRFQQFISGKQGQFGLVLTGQNQNILTKGSNSLNIFKGQWIDPDQTGIAVFLRMIGIVQTCHGGNIGHIRNGFRLYGRRLPAAAAEQQAKQHRDHLLHDYCLLARV